MTTTSKANRTASELIANVVAPAARPEDVETIIRYSNEHLLLVHGIKRAASIAGVKAGGIKPLAPEGGPGSFWATGNKIFCGEEPRPGSAGWTYDTPFFHYGHSASKDGPRTMALAMTDSARLASADIGQEDVRPDSQCILRETVPTSHLTLIVVEQVPGEPIQLTTLDFLARCAENGNLLRSGVYTNK